MFAVLEKSGYLSKAIGFKDGSNIKIARPGKGSLLQRACSSGHKRIYCITFQTVVTSDGLLFQLYCPVEGKQPENTCTGNLGWMID